MRKKGVGSGIADAVLGIGSAQGSDGRRWAAPAATSDEMREASPR